MMFRKTSEALVLASLVWAAPVQAQEHGSATPATVSVVGVASEEARPDIAVVILDVIDDRPNANEAANENARISTAVIDGLKGSGIDAKDIMTVGLSLAPVVTDQRDPKTNQIVKSVPNGFHASNVIRVRVREIDRTGAFIAAASRTERSIRACRSISPTARRARTRSGSRPWPMRCIARRSTPRALR